MLRRCALHLLCNHFLDDAACAGGPSVDFEHLEPTLRCCIEGALLRLHDDLILGEDTGVGGPKLCRQRLIMNPIATDERPEI